MSLPVAGFPRLLRPGVLLLVVLAAVTTLVWTGLLTTLSHPAPRRGTAARTTPVARCTPSMTLLAPRTVHLAVLNATATPHLARDLAAALHRRGFLIDGPIADDPDRHDGSVLIRYGTGDLAAACAVQRRIPAAQLAPLTMATPRVTISLGRPATLAG